MATSAVIRSIQPGDVLSGLSTGGDPDIKPLKTFLRRHAANYHVTNVAKTYAAFLPANPKKAVGYITLVCGEIATDPQLSNGDGFPYDHYPAVKIARLAVNSDLRGSGIGYQLTLLALGIVKEEICPRVGCRFVVLDAKQASIPFYVRQGFVLLDTPDNLKREHPVMFLDLNKH